MSDQIMKAQLTYFKSTGKWYSEGTWFWHKSVGWNTAVATIREAQQTGNLPGLCLGAGREFFVLMELEGDNVPRLLLPLEETE